MKKNLAILFITLFTGWLNCQWTTIAPTDFQEKLLLEVNQLRVSGCKCGETWMPPVPPLKWNTVLERASQRQADDMFQHKRMSHVGSDGTDIAIRVTEAGYDWEAVGENIAHGYETEAAVVAAWQKSPAHCKNMMKAYYTDMGVARSGNFWAQTFAKPRFKFSLDNKE